MVSNNINPKYNVPMQALGQSQVGGPVMQAVDAQAVKQTVDNSYLANRVKASSDADNSGAVVLATIPVWYGLSQAMDKVNAKCGGEFEKSLFGRIGAWGDNLSNKFSGTAVGKGTHKVTSTLGSWLDKLTAKSKFVYSLRNHKTAPEWSFAKTPAAGIKGYYVMDTMQVLEEFVNPISDTKIFSQEPGLNLIPAKCNSFQKLEQYGLNQKAIDTFKDSVKNLSFKDQAIALQKKELELLGADKAIIDKIFDKNGLKGLQIHARNLKVRRAGFDSFAHFSKLKENSIDNIDEIVKALGKGAQKGDLNISIWRNGGNSGKLTSHLFGRKVALSEIYNKGKIVTGQGAKTKLGKFLSKATAYFAEGTTNRYAGGKLAVLMQAAIFGDMLVHAYKAPKGEKGKTFAERFVNDFTYFMAMPLAIWGMHKVGGFKYAGLNKDQVNAYNDALKAFNAKAKAYGFANKAEYKAAAKELKNMLKGDVKLLKNPITKIFKWFGTNVINIGNGSKAAYRSKNSLNLNLLRRSKSFFKNLIGVPLRLSIPMALLLPMIVKPIVKGCHAIFGKPTNSVLDEDKEPEMTPEQQQEIERQLQQLQQLQKQAQNNPFDSQPIVHNSETNLLNMHKNGQKYQSSVVNNTTNTVLNNTDKADDDKVLEPKRTYIPSPVGVQVQGEDPTQAELVMSRADAAERKAMEVLAMKF